MEQLANMPLWAQLLSMGSFMFASGVLMTRIPLVPCMVLSLFYLYGALGNSAAMPAFTLKHPWVCVLIHVGVVLALVCFWVFVASAMMRGAGPDGISVGLTGIYLVAATAVVCLLGIIVSWFPAVVKWLNLLRALPSNGWEMYVWVALFVGGILSGILCFGGIDRLRALLDTNIASFVIVQIFAVAVVAVLVCVGSVAAIFLGTKPLGWGIGFVSCLLAIAIAGNGIYQWRLQHLYSKGQQPLLEAAEAGNTEQVRQLLSKGKSVNARDENDYTPLIEASNNGHLETVQLLLQKGAEVNAKARGGWTALMLASTGGHLPVVEELIKAGAEVDAVNEEKDSALVQALERGHFEVAKSLILAGADVNKTPHYPLPSMLHLATLHKGNAEVVKLILERGADVNKQNWNGSTPLQFTLGWNNKEEISRMIYAAGGRLGQITQEDQTGPMMDAACSYGFTEVVDQLLAAGVKPTPHHAIMAAQEGQTEVLKQLKAAGLDIHQPDDKGKHPFLSAVGLGHLETVQFFVENGADLTLRNGNVGPALLLASLEGYLPIVKYLIEQKAAVDIQNQFGETPLMMAAAKDHTAVALFLLEHGANVNKQKKVGTTALKYAAGRGNIPLIQALLKAGADINLADEDNDTPLIAACFEGHKEAVQELLKAGAKTNIRDKEGKTALGIALEKGHTEVVKLLQSAGAKE